MQLYELIRRVHEREGLSIRALAVRFGVHRRDVRAALDSALPAPRKAPERPAPKMDEFKAIIDAWLEADQSLPRKQRHTRGVCGNASSTNTTPIWASRPCAATSRSCANAKRHR